MSSTVFPATLPGLLMSLDRDVDFDVTTQKTLTRKELRYTYETIPITKYKLGFEILRSDSSLSNRARELQQVLTQIARHYGQLDSFLLTDLADSSVSDHGFGVGDGVTTAFQLQRTLGGDIIDAAGFEYQAQSKPYTNLVKNSSFETDTNADGLADNWSQYTNSPSLEPMTSVIVPGVNGGKAQRVSWGTANTTTKGIHSASGATPVWVPGQWYTISFLARGVFQAGAATAWMGLGWNTAPNSEVISDNPPISANFQRYVFQERWNPGTSPVAEMYLTIRPNANNSGSGPAIFGDLDFDDVLVVAGQYSAATLPQPNATPAAATGTRTPSYWPAFADGFEPISDLNGSPTIYEDNTWRGRRQLYPWPRTNVLFFSEQIDNAGWTKTNATISANATTAPDGTSTADQISEGVALGQHGVVSSGHPGEVPGQLWRWSVFLKAGNLPNIFLSEPGSFINGVKFNLGTGVIDGQAGTQTNGVITDPRWPGWYRVWFVVRATGTTGTNLFINGCLDSNYSGSNYTGTSRTFFAWGAMCERVSEVGPPTPYIPTPSSIAVTVTDYTLSSTGLVTLPAALASGAFLSFDGSYYRRVRFAERNLSVEQMVQSMWSAKAISLVSVKP